MTRAWLTLLIALLIVPAVAASQTADLSSLSHRDRTAFEDIVNSIDEWDGSVWAYNDIKDDIQKLSLAYPGLVPLEIELTRLEWCRISDWQGVRAGSMSFLPRFLQYAQQAPDYPKSHLTAARAYIFAQDYEGAMPSLNRATQLDPTNPLVDLTWSLLNERKFNRSLAVEAARAALKKSKGKPQTMAMAITAIAKNRGIQDLEAANAFAKGFASIEPDPEIRIKVAAGLIDSYYFQPGLLETAGAILNQSNIGKEPTPFLLLQWAKISMKTGYFYNKGNRDIYDQNYLENSKKILEYIKSQDGFEIKIQPYLLDIAISERKFDDAALIIEKMNKLGATKTWVAWANAQIFFAQRKYAEVIKIYEENLLSPRDTAYVEATTSRGLGSTRQKYLFYIEWDPASPYPYGNYASFLLYTAKDPAAAINYAREAMKIGPYPNVQMTLATALLFQSGILLRDGHLNEALKSYEEARTVGFDEEILLQQCYALCGEITGALTAFR